ncbi:MAG: XrtA system polysaccharide chain length determinant [Terracidiphilus sp.]
MPEIHEEHEPESLDVGRIFGILRRRHLHFLIPLFAGWLVVWIASWVLPPRYKSTTTILVEQPTMPQNYVLPNINDDLQSRLQSMSTQILSRTRLLMIIERLHLYGGAGDSSTAEERVDKMRKDIYVELVRDPQRQDISAFKISYSAKDPHVAQQVTGELTNLFINENLKTREQESEGTTSFIESQLEQARESLSEQEAKVRQFEAQHEGALPTQEASNLQILAGLQAQLQNEQDGLNTAKQQRVYLQAMLSEEKAAQSKNRPLNSDQPGQVGPADLALIDQQLDKLRDQLADLSSRYTDRYPDVQRLKDQIAKLEAQRNSVVAALKRRAAEPKADSDSPAANAVVDPAGSAAIRQLQGQLQANQLEIANRESAIEGLKTRINEYQGRLNLTPATEQELADLTRGYEQSKANYDDLLKKKNQSEMATSMEQMQQGERFTMLDPPSLPTKPDFPNRLKFCGIGLGVGLALGLIVAGSFALLDDRLYTEKEIKALLPVAVISEIPEVASPLDEQIAKRKQAWGWAASALVLVTIVAGSVFSYLRN